MALASLECGMQAKLALHSQRSTYVCLLSAGIKGVYYLI